MNWKVPDFYLKERRRIRKKGSRAEENNFSCRQSKRGRKPARLPGQYHPGGKEVFQLRPRWKMGKQGSGLGAFCSGKERGKALNRVYLKHLQEPNRSRPKKRGANRLGGLGPRSENGGKKTKTAEHKSGKEHRVSRRARRLSFTEGRSMQTDMN